MSTSAKRVTARPRMSIVRMVAILGAIAISTSGWVTMTALEPDGRLIAAELDDASPVIPGIDVKVDGVVVGQVADMHVVDGEKGAKRARLTLHLDNAALPVYEDARVTLRASSLLGERYLDLERGSTSARVLGEGEVLPASRNTQATDLDQVLDTIDQPTGRALAELVVALGAGLDGNGQDAAKAIKALGPAMSDTSALTAILLEHNELLGGLVDKLEPVVTGLAADDGKALDTLVASAAQISAAAAQQNRQLSDTLAELPGTLAQARKTLGRLTGTAQQTTPTLRALRPLTDDLTAISAEVEGFADSANRALASARPVLDDAHRLLTQARPVAAELRKAAPDIRSVAANARPVVDRLAGNIGDVLEFVRTWALATNGYDGLSHYFRGQVVVDPAMADALLARVTGSAGQGKPRPAPQDSVPAPKLPLGDAPVVPGLLGSPDADGGVTGLTSRQESGVLGFLIGGGS